MSTNGSSGTKYGGQLVRFGDRELVIPSLSIKQARDLWPAMQDMDKGVTTENLPERHATAAKIIHAALTRNYPDMKLEEVEDLVDLGNLKDLMRIVSGQSGLGPGEKPAAEAGAPAAT